MCIPFCALCSVILCPVVGHDPRHRLIVLSGVLYHHFTSCSDSDYTTRVIILIFDLYLKFRY